MSPLSIARSMTWIQRGVIMTLDTVEPRHPRTHTVTTIRLLWPYIYPTRTPKRGWLLNSLGAEVKAAIPTLGGAEPIDVARNLTPAQRRLLQTLEKDKYYNWCSLTINRRTRQVVSRFTEASPMDKNCRRLTEDGHLVKIAAGMIQ